MRQAFKPDGGILTDDQAERGEQQATMELFSGAIGAFKKLDESPNPSTSTTHWKRPEIIQLADLLLRILRRA